MSGAFQKGERIDGALGRDLGAKQDGAGPPFFSGQVGVGGSGVLGWVGASEDGGAGGGGGEIGGGRGGGEPGGEGGGGERVRKRGSRGSFRDRFGRGGRGGENGVGNDLGLAGGRFDQGNFHRKIGGLNGKIATCRDGGTRQKETGMEGD